MMRSKHGFSKNYQGQREVGCVFGKVLLNQAPGNPYIPCLWVYRTKSLETLDTYKNSTVYKLLKTVFKFL